MGPNDRNLLLRKVRLQPVGALSIFVGAILGSDNVDRVGILIVWQRGYLDPAVAVGPDRLRMARNLIHQVTDRGCDRRMSVSNACEDHCAYNQFQDYALSSAGCCGRRRTRR